MGGQLDELLASLAARYRGSLPYSIYCILFVYSLYCTVTNKYDGDDESHLHK